MYQEKVLMQAVSPLTFHVVCLDAQEGEEPMEWQGTFFLTVKDKCWPEAPEQTDENVDDPKIGMAAFQFSSEANEGAIKVSQYFKMEKKRGSESGER